MICLFVAGLLAGRRYRARQLELRHCRGGNLFPDIARLIEIPVIELVGLRLLHRLHDVVVFDFAHPKKCRQERHGDGDPGAKVRMLIP